MVLASGWDRRSPLLDPFCGSGTIPIEAAMIAAGVAPGRNRTFRFMQWPGYDSKEWARLHSTARKREQPDSVPLIVGADRSTAAIRAATDNAERAGVASLVRFGKEDALDLDGGPDAGWVVTNPPYGVRLGDSGEARNLMARFGETLRERFGGWKVTVLAPAQLERVMRIPLKAGFRTTNGGLKVQFLAGVVTNGQGQPDV
jgi:putative N6-adenine-specific DNA methylase